MPPAENRLDAETGRVAPLEHRLNPRRETRRSLRLVAAFRRLEGGDGALPSASSFLRQRTSPKNDKPLPKKQVEPRLPAEKKQVAKGESHNFKKLYLK